jgi:dTDP-glucose pyrophosphorylase
MNNFKNHCIQSNFSIYQSLKSLKKTGDRCLLITNKNNDLLGTLTDGDLRTALIKGANLKSSIKSLFNKKPKYILENQINDKNLIKKLLIEYSIDILPVLKNKKIIRVIRWVEFFSDDINKNKINIDAIIMAGGKGTRLAPFTNVLPKPLIPINNKPLISIILENLKKGNVREYWFCINYKWQIIKSYLSSTENKININYIKEKKPLGTVGALGLIPKAKISENFILTNCDVLLDNEIKPLIDFHNSQKSDLTIVIAKKVFKMPYGACKISKSKTLLKIDEKPIHSYMINTGFYILNKKILKFIKKDKYLDMNDLIKILKLNKKKILCYPINESEWADFGVWESYYKERKYFGGEKFKE